jgi:hypothetical protein
MLKRYLLSAAIVLASTTALVQAQAQSGAPAQQPTPAPQTAPAPQPAPQPTPAPQSVASQKNPSIVLSGCLVREQDVPGRQPNVAERAGVMEDYILTAAKAGGERPASGAPGAVGTTGTATQNISRMYKVEGIPDEKLKALVGKHVEVTGRLDEDDTREVKPNAPAGAATPRTPGDDMPEFEATAIREVPGSCATSPNR